MVDHLPAFPEAAAVVDAVGAIFLARDHSEQWIRHQHINVGIAGKGLQKNRFGTVVGWTDIHDEFPPQFMDRERVDSLLQSDERDRYDDHIQSSKEVGGIVMKVDAEFCCLFRLIVHVQAGDLVVVVDHSRSEDLTKRAESHQSNAKRVVDGGAVATHVHRRVGIVRNALDLDFRRCSLDRADQLRLAGIGTQDAHEIREFPQIGQGVLAVA
mmetsp:Transcript_34020/g.80096  ORF Transcript_34020/g.80096 Transcript_34020/m.80096 type:complete len:212 (-) Transcript_34020:1344-1979(-)